MEQRIQQRVMDLTAKTKNSMLNETGISSYSLMRKILNII